MRKHDEYFKTAQSWGDEIYASLRASKNRAWLITGFAMLVCLLCMAALLLLLPLKSFAPYVITLEQDSGYVAVTKGLQESALSEDEALTQSNLVRYVNAREAYNPAVLRENYDFITLLSDESALIEFQKLWGAQNPDNPSIKYGRKSTIDIKIKSVSLLNESTASVRFMRALHEQSTVKQTHWNAIITFKYVQKPMKMGERFSNPLGFKVTTYRINPEGLESIK